MIERKAIAVEVPEGKDIAVKVCSMFSKQWTYIAISSPPCNFTNDRQFIENLLGLLTKHVLVTSFLISSNHLFYCDQEWHSYISFSSSNWNQNLHNWAWQIVKGNCSLGLSREQEHGRRKRYSNKSARRKRYCSQTALIVLPTMSFYWYIYSSLQFC